MLTRIRYRHLGLLALLFVSALFLSPKWFIAPAVWVHYTVLLYWLRTQRLGGWLAAYVVLWSATVLAQWEVFPLPLPQLAVFMLIASAVGLLPPLIDRLVYRRFPPLVASLVFPVTATLLDVLLAQGPQGTWGNPAYTQFSFSPLMQVASVTGIYGISFLYSWFAASAVGWLQRRTGPIGLLPFGLMFATVLIYGGSRLRATPEADNKTPVAAVHVDNLPILERMYQLAVAPPPELPAAVSMSDPRLAELQRGLPPFMAEPNAERFAGVHQTIDSIQRAYFAASAAAVARGARIVSWSEGAILTTKDRESALQERAARFAAEHDCYLFYATAVFHPEMVGHAAHYIENKVLTFAPDGQLRNTYFKNIPIMGVEPSFPGDGTIPVIESPYGKLSPLICYDADHPQLTAQTSDLETDLLVVPTGDWRAIAPYHTYMAAVRCIENGTTMLKATSRGTSALIDTRGRLLATADLAGTTGDQILSGLLPIGSVSTPYAVTAPLFKYTLIGLAGLGAVYLLITGVRARRTAKDI